MRFSWRTLLLVAGFSVCAGYGLAEGVTAVGRPVSLSDVVRETPIDPQTGATIRPIATGEFATVNVWQLAGAIPPHYHRAHEEIVIAQSGTGEARVGDHTYALKAGDILLIPKNVVHAVHATGPVPFRGISVFGPAFDGTDRVFVQQK